MSGWSEKYFCREIRPLDVFGRERFKTVPYADGQTSI
jgi:hypothetical protein